MQRGNAKRRGEGSESESERDLEMRRTKEKVCVNEVKEGANEGSSRSQREREKLKDSFLSFIHKRKRELYSFGLYMCVVYVPLLPQP